MNKKRGFSLTEILVAIGLLAIVSSIATIGYNSYIKTSKVSAIKQALKKLEGAFNTCMSFNGFDVTKCDTEAKLDYTKSPKHKIFSNTQSNKICFALRQHPVTEVRKNGLRGCFQYTTDGSIVRRCFDKPENGSAGIASCIATGVCCTACTHVCEVGKGKAATS